MKNQNDFDLLNKKLKTKASIISWRYFFLFGIPLVFIFPFIPHKNKRGSDPLFSSYKTEVTFAFIITIIAFIYGKIKQDDAVEKRFENPDTMPEIIQSDFMVTRFRNRLFYLQTIILKDEQGNKIELEALKSDVKNVQIGDQVFIKYDKLNNFLFHINNKKRPTL